MSSVFALVDCDNFYVSCERVFDATLRGRPVVVLSNNDGCVVSRSEEAKRLGIRMGAPVFQAQDIIRRHGVRVFSSNYALYGDMSARVMCVLGDFTPEVEVYSIDEAFLSVEARGASRSDYARLIQSKVYKWTGVPVTVGLGRTKTLAKLASTHAKRVPGGGVLDLTGASELEAALAASPVEDVWGVGRRYAKLLRGRGIGTARELRDADLAWVRRNMTVTGARVVEELRGRSCLPLEVCPPARKSLTVSRSFGRAVETLEELREAVGSFASRAAEKLLKAGLVAGALTVLVATNRFSKEDFYADSATVELAFPTDATAELLAYAYACCARLYRPGLKFKKAGV
ncbi:MAG TPA: Y-family DNA polymerase, partial [Pyrinomonadaceae bacterium]|nr:Y-family DNA polymerase [Pyrinomonadaceae bacterium]